MSATQRWRFDLAYDGSFFQGFAIQPGAVTVVSELRAALTTALQLAEPPYLVGAGRTDTGVHALAQVVHCDLEGDALNDPQRIARAVRSCNSLLRGRIQITRATRVGGHFDARRSATWREYRYLVVPTQLPTLTLVRGWAWPVAGPLDLGAMNEAGAALVGEHDFRAFCKRAVDKAPDDPIVRRVVLAHWSEHADELAVSAGRESIVKLTIRAQSFCHRMVRGVVSTMVAVGQGRLEVDEVTRRLENHHRDHLPPPAPPGALALVGVGYPPGDGGDAGSPAAAPEFGGRSSSR